MSKSMNKAKLTTILIAAVFAPMAFGQFEQFMGQGGGGGSKAWEGFKYDQNKKLKLDFRGANPDLIITTLSKASGINIVKDPALVQPMTLTSSTDVTISQAFTMLNASLNLMSYDLRKDGDILVIQKRNQRGNDGRGGGGNSGMDMGRIFEMMNQGNQQPEIVLKWYAIKYANASQVARVVNEVFLGMGVQQGGFNPMQMFGGGQFNRGGRGGNPFQNFRMPGAQQGGMNVRASSDDYSNQVIVAATSDVQRQVEDLIKGLDIQVEETQRPIVYPLTYASATDLAPVVQNVLTSNAPLGRGGIRNQSQQVPFEQRISNAFRMGNSQAGFGSVVAETRTNALVVTATDDNHVLVKKVVEQLDQEVVVQNSTFVVPLNNARADQVATLFQQAFGNRNTGNRTNTGGFGGNTQNRNNQNRNNQNRNNQNRNTGGGLQGGGRGFDPVMSGDSLDLNLADPDANSGELATEVYAQMFGGGQFRPQTQQQQGGQTGRDEQGRLINVRDLQNQITVIPDTNTNSLIVVTTPENADLVQSILAQLDKIPEQVMIETVIVEATLDSSTKLGVEWSYLQDPAFRNSGTEGRIDQDFNLNNNQDPARGFKYTLAGGKWELFLNALKTDSRFEVLSTPRIFTSNNVQAQINISQSVPYVLSSREDANGNLTFTYAFQDVGIVLTVTPRITANGFVTMDVSQTANDLQGFTDFNAPIVNQRQADTTVTVKDGETIILGGIIRSTVTATTRKIPLLGDIPILGNLFKTSTKENSKTELLVFLTPRIVRNPEEAGKLKDDLQGAMSPASKAILQKAISGGATKGNGNGGTGTGAGGTGGGGGGN